MNKKRALMVSYRFPWPEYKGGYNLRVLNFAKILKEDHNVDLLSLYENNSEAKKQKELKEIFDNVFLFQKTKIEEYIDTLKSVFKGDPLQIGYYKSDKIKSWLKKNYQNYDILFFFTMRSIEYGENLKNFKVIDLIDSISLNYERARDFPGVFWKLIYKIEISRLKKFEVKKILENKFDRYFISSQFDKNYFREHAKDKSNIEKMIVIPNGINEKIFSSSCVSKENENLISFLGKMDTRPNQDAVIFFSKKIFPLVKKEVPDLKFLIIGINPTKQVKDLEHLEGIKVTGYLKDPYSFLEKSKVIVSPLRFGAGIQNKVLEAMALGKAVLASTISIKGIEGIVPGRHIEIVDPKDYKLWASKILELILNKEKRENIGREGKKLMEENYRWNRIGERLLEKLENRPAD